MGRVEDQLAEAREENRQLHEALEGYSAMRWEGVHLGARPTLMLAMLSTGGTYTSSQFLDALQSRFPLEGERHRKAVNTNIFRIRRVLSRADPRIVICSQGWRGYWLEADSRALLQARRVTLADILRSDTLATGVE